MPYDDYHDDRLADIDYGRPHYFDGPDYYDPTPNDDDDAACGIDHDLKRADAEYVEHIRPVIGANYVIVRRDDYDNLAATIDERTHDLDDYLADVLIAARALVDHTVDDRLADGIHRHLNP